MPRVCSICGLSNKRGRETGVFLHELPADIVRRKQWVDAVYKLTGEHRMLQWQSVNYTICSRHFNKSDYKPEYKIRILEKNVIPTILGPPLEPRARARPVRRQATNGRLSDKDLEAVLVQAAFSASTPENGKTVQKTAASRKKEATPGEDTAAISEDTTCDQKMDDETSTPRKQKVDGETSLPQKQKTEGETTAPSKKKADGETSRPRKERAEGETTLPRKKRAEVGTTSPRKKKTDGETTSPRKKKAVDGTLLPRKKKKKAGDKTSVPRKKKEDESTIVAGEEGAIPATEEQREDQLEDPIDWGVSEESSDEEDEGEGSPGRSRSRTESATTTLRRLASVRRKAKNLRRQVARRDARVRRLRQRLSDALRDARRASSEAWWCRGGRENKAFAAVVREARQGDMRAQFLLEQVRNFGKQKTRWSEPFVRECVLLCAVSAPTYDLVRTSPLLQGAPSRTTLRRFIGWCGQGGDGAKDGEAEVGEAEDLEDEEAFIMKMEDELGNSDEVEEELSDFSCYKEDAVEDTMKDQE